ncbi:N-acetyllactosaminide beta-1,3-N-acetylglucosaminyltransferase 3-like [Lampetra fluviatilis]
MPIPRKYVICVLSVIMVASFLFTLHGVENLMPWLEAIRGLGPTAPALPALPALPEMPALPSKPAENYTEPCYPRANIAAEVADFGSLPQHMQQFMTYRHCRRFPIIIDQPNKCAGVKPDQPLLLLVIKSLSESYSKRHAIRQTWGQEVAVRGLQVRLLFLIGVSDNEARRPLYNRFLREEAAKNGDILQWGFLDTFLNLTVKQVNFLHWLNHSCPHAAFIYNGDDDMFLHTVNLAELLLGYPRGDLYVGHIIDDTPPVRYVPSKYYVPKQLWPHSTYPAYVGGGGLAMAGSTALKFLNASYSLEIFPIDDVFFGLCAESTHVKVINHLGFRTYGVDALLASNRDALPNNYVLNELICVHKFDPNEIMVMWQKITQDLEKK